MSTMRMQWVRLACGPQHVCKFDDAARLLSTLNKLSFNCNDLRPTWFV